MRRCLSAWCVQALYSAMAGQKLRRARAGAGAGARAKKLSQNGMFFWPKRSNCESLGRFRPNPGTSGQNSGTHATFTGRQ